MRLSSACAA